MMTSCSDILCKALIAFSMPWALDQELDILKIILLHEQSVGCTSEDLPTELPCACVGQRVLRNEVYTLPL